MFLEHVVVGILTPDDQRGRYSSYFPVDLNAASASLSAATMASSCHIWTPDRGWSSKHYGVVVLLFMDLVLQSVSGMFAKVVRHLQAFIDNL